MTYNALILGPIRPMMTPMPMVYCHGLTCHVVESARAIVASFTTLILPARP